MRPVLESAVDTGVLAGFSLCFYRIFPHTYLASRQIPGFAAALNTIQFLVSLDTT